MHTTNYYNTFIQVADDCPVDNAEIPPVKKPQSVAQIEYEMLVTNPYKYTSDDVLFTASCGQERVLPATQALRKLRQAQRN